MDALLPDVDGMKEMDDAGRQAVVWYVLYFVQELELIHWICLTRIVVIDVCNYCSLDAQELLEIAKVFIFSRGLN